MLVVSSPAVHAELLALAQRGGLPQQLLDQASGCRKRFWFAVLHANPFRPHVRLHSCLAA